MKKLLLTLIVFAGIPAMAGNYSAFTQGRMLYVTIMGDTCNTFAGGLLVEGMCQDDRNTRNWATECSAALAVRSTKMFCAEAAPVVLEIDLDEANVAKEAEVLTLDYFGEVIEVKL